MNLPIPPTDNLYKFMALSGLVTLGFSIIYPVHLVQEYNELAIQLEEKVEIKTLESDRIEANLEKIDKELEELAQIDLQDKEESRFGEEELLNLKKNMQDPDYREYVKFFREYQDLLIPNREKLKEIKKLSSELEEKHYLSMISTIEIVKANERLAFLRRKIEAIKTAAKLANFFGTILTVLGFTLWYHKVQKPMDLKLQSESHSTPNE